jgi:hypothetical protein
MSDQNPKPKKKWDFWGLLGAGARAAMSDEPEKELRALADDVTKDVHEGMKENQRKAEGILDTTAEVVDEPKRGPA